MELGQPYKSREEKIFKLVPKAKVNLNEIK
jgi:hypothetical protein